MSNTTLNRLRKDRGAMAGMVILILFVITAIMAPVISPYDPMAQNLQEGLRPPSIHHPFGQDKLGRDILSRVIFGSRVSLKVGLIAVTVSLIIGTLLGSWAGFASGAVDHIITRLIDIVMAFPGILLALAVMAVLGPSLNNVILALCLVSWVGFARLARGQVLSIKERDYIQAAKAVGASPLRLLFVHIFPNIISPLLVEATFGIGSAIVAEAGLSFLGLGVQPPTPSWGSMLNEGRQFMMQAPHMTIFPGLAIMLVVMAINFLGDGLRDAIDPKAHYRHALAA